MLPLAKAVLEQHGTSAKLIPVTVTQVSPLQVTLLGGTVNGVPIGGGGYALGAANAIVTAGVAPVILPNSAPAIDAYTKAQTDALVASPGAIAPTTINLSGLLTANPGVTSTDVYNRVLTSGYSVQYVDSTGRMGTVPSSEKFKQDITPTTIDPAAVYAAQIVTFRYDAAVEQMGDAAPTEIGGIAEQFDSCGLSAFVTRDEGGDLRGIAYEKLSVALIAVVQDQNRRISALEAKQV